MESSLQRNDAPTMELPDYPTAFMQQGKIKHQINSYLQRQSQLESNARSYPRRIPIAIAQAQGMYVKDTEGHLYLDCLAGAGTLALGHNHPVIHKALYQHLESGQPLHTLDITTPVKDQFIQDIFDILPLSFAKRARIQFCGPTGADAVEAALKLVKTATGRNTILPFAGGYHGMTHGALSIMGNISTKSPISNLMGNVQFLPYPYAYRCPFGLSGQQSIDTHLRFIENVLSDPESGVPAPAAVILEAVQGEGGAIPAPIEWLQGIRRLTQKYDIPLILDEIQTGIGRTGHMFAFEHADITPDVIVISKAIGGGLPLSVIIYDESLDSWQPGAHTGTFRGNQLAMAAGSATLDYIQAHQLDKHAGQMGQRLMQHLQAIQQDYPAIGDVRGRGLMIGIEIVDTQQAADNLGSHPTHPRLASEIQRQCLALGLILELGGRHGSTVRLLPPLIVTQTEVDRIAQILRQAIHTALQTVSLA